LISIIRKRLDSYNVSNQLEEEHAIKEIIQNIALYGLWRERAPLRGELAANCT